jgi:hypothetical protein
MGAHHSVPVARPEAGQQQRNVRNGGIEPRSPTVIRPMNELPGHALGPYAEHDNVDSLC